MRFIDETTLEVRAGKGGDGCVAFRREKYRPMGGPSGGNGGHGGDVVFVADRNLSTLLDLHYRKLYKAPHGENGRGRDQHGKNGEDERIRVPTGTILYDLETGELLADLTEDKQEFIAAEGGNGGFGNMQFTTSTRQAPDFALPGQEGTTRKLKLELKLLADVGVIGFPNVGKSTFISKVSKARPKIADYPFTTLTPNLGVVRAPGRQAFVMADVPGLIPDAHKGVGLGIRFLRHVERTRTFLHMLELSDDSTRDPIQDFEVLKRELELYDESTGSELAKKATIVALNKVEDNEIREICEQEYNDYFEQKGIPFFVISAQTGENCIPLLHALTDQIEDNRTEEEKPPQKQNISWNPLGN